MKTPWKRALAVAIGACLVMLGAPIAPAAATTTTQRVATAVWTLTNGCIETQIVVYSSQSPTATGGAAQDFFFLSQQQTCDDPYVVQPVLEIIGQFTGGQLQVSQDLRSGSLLATGPVTCNAYAVGACDQAPYNAGSVSLNLTWVTGGKITTTTDGDQTCRYRYGQATGSILLGAVDLLGAGAIRSDPTETDLALCTPR